MKRRLAGALVAFAIGCGDDDESCKEADKVAEEIRRAAELDGITGAPCIEGPQLPSADRAAEYQTACARYSELKKQCDG